MADFASALKALKSGQKVTRAGWNGKDQFVWYVPAGEYPARMEAVKGEFDNDQVPYDAYFALKNAQGKVVPWTPSVSDILATDWDTVGGKK